MRHVARITLVATTFLVALALASPAEANDRRDPRHRVEHRHQRHHAHHKHHRQFDRYDHRAFRHERSFRYDRFDIPHRIHGNRRNVVREYHEGSVYFAPHRHRHAVYVFPVRIGHSWGFREHFYCDGDLFFDHHGRVDFHGRRFSISLGF